MLWLVCRGIIYCRGCGQYRHSAPHSSPRLVSAHRSITLPHLQGLPVLTMQGDDYPARVAASLYAGLRPSSGPSRGPGPLMVVDSLRAFEDTAVRLLRNRYSTDRYTGPQIRGHSKGGQSDVLRTVGSMLLSTRGLDELEAARKFLGVMEAVAEVEGSQVIKFFQAPTGINSSEWRRKPHVILTGKLRWCFSLNDGVELDSNKNRRSYIMQRTLQ